MIDNSLHHAPSDLWFLASYAETAYPLVRTPREFPHHPWDHVTQGCAGNYKRRHAYEQSVTTADYDNHTGVNRYSDT